MDSTRYALAEHNKFRKDKKNNYLHNFYYDNVFSNKIVLVPFKFHELSTIQLIIF